MSKETVTSILYIVDDYGKRDGIVAVSTNFRTVRTWVKAYAAEYVNIDQHSNGCKLSIIYYNGLQSVSSFQTIADVISIIKHWNTLKKQDDRVEFYINGDFVGDSVGDAVAWYEDRQYADGYLSETPY